jgi:hypothetical protein
MLSSFAPLGREEDPAFCEVSKLIRAISNHDSSGCLGKAVFEPGIDARAMDCGTDATRGVIPERSLKAPLEANIGVAIVAKIL